ncbi:MAG: F0F1 ATP synthase subunit B [Candidatus Omnitrophota bacterium]
MELLKLLSANEVVAEALSFILLLVLLRIFAWNKILKILDDRRDRIALEFKKIEEARAETLRSKGEYEDKVATIKEEADRIIKEAVSESRKISDEVRKNAHLQAQEIINNAKDNIRHELSAAKEELKEKIVELTISATEQVIQEKLNEELDKKIIRNFLEKVEDL